MRFCNITRILTGTEQYSVTLQHQPNAALKSLKVANLSSKQPFNHISPFIRLLSTDYMTSSEHWLVQNNIMQINQGKSYGFYSITTPKRQICLQEHELEEEIVFVGEYKVMEVEFQYNQILRYLMQFNDQEVTPEQLNQLAEQLVNQQNNEQLQIALSDQAAMEHTDIQKLLEQLQKEGNNEEAIQLISSKLAAQEQMGKLQQLEQQQILLNNQRIEELQLEFLKQDPNLTAENLQQLVEQQIHLDALGQVDLPLEDGIQLLVNGQATIDDLARIYSVDKEQLENYLIEQLQGNSQLQEGVAGQQMNGEWAQLQNMAHQGQLDIHRKALSAGDKVPAASQSSSVDSEVIQMYEKQKDADYARQLRLFYKSMKDNLSKETMGILSKESEQLCQKIDDAQRAYVRLRKQMRDQRVLINQGPNSVNQPTAARSETSSLSEADIGQDNDGDSMFKQHLYGPDSNIDPNDFILKVMNSLQNQPELIRQFKRFLPENDEDEIKSMRKKILSVNEDLEQVDNQLLEQLKVATFQELYELLQEYQLAKEKKTISEALQEYGDKIMGITEKYQKYVACELEQQLRQERAINNQNQNISLTDFEPDIINNYVEKLGAQMELILNILPQEILDNFSLDSSGLQFDKDKPEPNEDFLQKSPQQLKQSQAQQVSNKKYKRKQEYDYIQTSQSNEDSSSQLSEYEQNVAQTDYVSAQLQQKGKSISSELSNLPNSSIYKAELRVFDQLQRALKTNDEWHSFCKLFLLYQDGVICQNDFMSMFREKFSAKLRTDLKKDLENLLPSRDSQRKHSSYLLKPWNELDNQTFRKIHEQSYIKIFDNFPVPICSAKENPKNLLVYKQFLNDKYLSLSMGSENFKFKVRNIHEDSIFKNEDDMYKLDMQIENFRKCERIIKKEIDYLNTLSTKDQTKYEFPHYKLKPLMYYWEKQYRDELIPYITKQNLGKVALMQLRDGLGGKLYQLDIARYEQRKQFEEVFRRHYIKSLDHRSFQYNKDFIKKLQQKPQHFSEIRSVSQANMSGRKRPVNQLKGGNLIQSPFYHSFGKFLKNNLKSLTNNNLHKDCEMDLEYVNNNFSTQQIEKLPHQRFLLQDQIGLQITVKLIILHINYSSTHHNYDRPKLLKSFKQILCNFFQFQPFDEIAAQCSEKSNIECLQPQQIELIMNQDSLLWYRNRVKQISQGQNQQNSRNSQLEHAETPQRVLRTRNNDEKLQAVDIPPIKIQMQGSYESKSVPLSFSGQNSSKNFIDQDQMQYGISQQQDSLFLPPSNQNYKLMFAPSNFYMFIKFFHALYERITYAKVLITEKLEADLIEMSKEEKERLQIIQNGEMNQEFFTKFQTERYEHLLKGIFATTSGISSSSVPQVGNFQLSNFTHGHNLMDHNKYEDFARQLLGKNAFLLFQIDKIMAQAMKQLSQMISDIVYNEAIKLCSNQGNSERAYLAQYVQLTVEQLDLVEGRERSMGKSKKETAKNRIAKIEGPNHMDGEQNLVDSHGHFCSLQALQQTNFQLFRLLYSPISHTLAVHYLCLNPYLFLQTGQLTYGKAIQSSFESLHEICHSQAEPSSNKLGHRDHSAPVFLKRNLTKMKEKRDLDKLVKEGRVLVKNGLKYQLTPVTGQISLNVGDEDIFLVNRSKPSKEETRSFDVRKQCLAGIIRSRQLQEDQKSNCQATSANKRRKK